MKQSLSFCAVILMMLASATLIYGDIARPKPSPAKEGKIVFHTGLTVVPDANLSEARLQISQESLGSLREALATTPTEQSLLQRISHSSTSTVMAGVFLFLSISFAGVWLARSGARRSHKTAAAVLLAAVVFGAATIMIRANAGPPGYYRWQNLPQNLTKGESTTGGLDIEIVPGSGTMKLIVPLKKTQRPKGDE